MCNPEVVLLLVLQNNISAKKSLPTMCLMTYVESATMYNLGLTNRATFGEWGVISTLFWVWG